MKPKPIPKNEMTLLLAYVNGDLSRKGLSEALGLKNKTGGAWWAGLRAVRGIRAGQFKLIKK